MQKMQIKSMVESRICTTNEGEDDVTQEKPWPVSRILKVSGFITLVATVLLALNAGKEWIPFGIFIWAVTFWLIEKATMGANTATERAAVEQQAVAEQERADQLTLERAAAEQAARDAQMAAAAQEAEQARVAAAEKAADQLLFDDLVQEAHRQIAEERRGE